MAGTFEFIGPYTCDQGIAEIDSDKQAPLGLIVQAVDTGSDDRGVGEFIYLKGVASTAIGSVVLYSADDWSTALASANGVGSIAVAMAASVANKYGWYQISGKGSAKVLASFADNGDCYLTSTAGSIDDDDVAGDYVANMLGASGISGGLADVEISRPSVADGKDN